MLKRDLLRRYNTTQGGKLSRLLECYRSPGVHAVIVFRLGHWSLSRPFFVRIGLKPLYLFLHHRMLVKWGIQIDAEANIGEGLLIYHFGGIFVGSGVTIGENLTISHNVTIGQAGDGERRGAPIIGENVYIAPGANISGKIRIGNNVKIGANAVVNKDVPDNALVQMQKVQIVTFPSQYGQPDSPTNSEA
jgi:serine O-acetyltransferase